MAKTEVSPEAYDVKLPQNVYRIRVADAILGKSKAGHAMDTLDLEIIEHAPVKHGESEVDINGIQLKSWNVRTAKTLPFYNKMRVCLGLPPLMADEVGSVNPRDYIGLTGYVVLASKGTPRVNDVTGEVLKHPTTGEPLVTWQREILEWIA